MKLRDVLKVLNTSAKVNMTTNMCGVEAVIDSYADYILKDAKDELLDSLVKQVSPDWDVDEGKFVIELEENGEA